MPARKPRVPQLRPKRVSAHVYAIAKFNRRELSFGRWDDPDSVLQFHAYLLRWEENGRRPIKRSDDAPRFAIKTLAQRFNAHAALHYRGRDGISTREEVNFKHALHHLVKVCGDEPVEHFDASRLEMVRESMHAPTERCPGGLARNTINARIRRIKQVFRWGRRNRLVPASVVQDIQDVASLSMGRSRARETEEVPPVTWANVQPVLAHVSAPIAALIRLQWFTGMRPGEAVALCPREINQTPMDVPMVVERNANGGDVWTYEPRKHKNSWRGQRHRIYMLAEAQEVLRPFLLRVPRPQQDLPLFASNDPRSRKRPRGDLPPPEPCYTTASYGNAVRRGIRSVNASRAKDGIMATLRKASISQATTWQVNRDALVDSRTGQIRGSLILLERALRRITEPEHTSEALELALSALADTHALEDWSPNQIRHSCGTRFRQASGADFAQVMLGHRSGAMIERYARADATEVAMPEPPASQCHP